MSDTKRLFAKPQYPVHIFSGRQGEWPEIGPEWTELTPEQLAAATAGARECAVELQVLEVGSAQELLEEVQGQADSTGAEPVMVRVAPPSANASTDEWRAYAESRGLQVFEGAKRSDIQAIVAEADEPQNEEA